jgi:hypothetical protein
MPERPQPLLRPPQVGARETGQRQQGVVGLKDVTEQDDRVVIGFECVQKPREAVQIVLEAVSVSTNADVEIGKGRDPQRR